MLAAGKGCSGAPRIFIIPPSVCVRVQRRWQGGASVETSADAAEREMVKYTVQCNALIVIQIPSEFPFQMKILSSNAI